MTRSTPSSTDYIIDVRDVIARFEELEAVLVNEPDNFSHDESEEYGRLKSLLDELKGNGREEQWRGDWYPITLISDSYFEDAMDELLEDIGDIPKDLPSYLTITVDYRALQMDYTSCEFDGVTYWYR